MRVKTFFDLADILGTNLDDNLAFVCRWEYLFIVYLVGLCLEGYRVGPSLNNTLGSLLILIARFIARATILQIRSRPLYTVIWTG